MSSISKSKVSWVNLLLLWCLSGLAAPVFAAADPDMHWQARHPDVSLYEDLYRRQLGKIQGLLNRSAPSLRLVVSQLQRRKLPLELVFVPLVESGYNPYAESPVGAMGPWQLMPQTAQQYGVIRNDWFDGRKDLLASTRGALDYLSYLHSLFERDWLLALAAYNAGEGRVQTAIKQNGNRARQADFWSLALPEETQQYVPKLLALVRLYRAGHLTLPEVPDASRLVALHVEDGVSLNWLAKQLGKPLEALSYYNAGLEKTVAPRGSRVALLMPASWGKRARQALGAGVRAIPQVEENNEPVRAQRRTLSDEELRTLGWGVALIQHHPGAVDLYSKRGESETGDSGKKGASIAPHWRAKIAPLSQWNNDITAQADTP